MIAGGTAFGAGLGHFAVDEGDGQSIAIQGHRSGISLWYAGKD